MDIQDLFSTTTNIEINGTFDSTFPLEVSFIEANGEPTPSPSLDPLSETPFGVTLSIVDNDIFSGLDPVIQYDFEM